MSMPVFCFCSYSVVGLAAVVAVVVVVTAGAIDMDVFLLFFLNPFLQVLMSMPVFCFCSYSVVGPVAADGLVAVVVAGLVAVVVTAVLPLFLILSSRC